MSLIDSQSILEYRRAITKTCYSRHAMDFRACADYGLGQPLYLDVKIDGNHTKNLRAQLVGFKDTTFTDPVVIADTGLHPSAELVEGKHLYAQIVQTDKKYRYIAVRFIPSADGTTESTDVDVSATYNPEELIKFSPVKKVGEDLPAVANGVSAYLVANIPTDVEYPSVNKNKITAGV